MNFETILRFKQFDFLVCYRKLSAHMHMLQYLHYNIGNMHTIFNRLECLGMKYRGKDLHATHSHSASNCSCTHIRRTFI